MRVTVIYLVVLTFASHGFLSCKKPTSDSTTTSQRPLTPPRTVKAKIIELSSDEPIAAAELTICPELLDYEGTCPGNLKEYLSNVKGVATFPAAAQYCIGSVLKDGYWNLDEWTTECLFEDALPNDNVYNLSYAKFDDSFVVRKVPITNLTIRIRNANVNPADRVWFVWAAQIQARFPVSNLIQCRYPFFLNMMFLRPSIDTVFRYPVFGNAVNIFTITNSDDYRLNHPVGIIYQETKYIPKAYNSTLDIVY